MTKQTVELNIPEGYEVAEGEQPRKSKEGELIWSPQWAGPVISDGGTCLYIILRKKLPEYTIVEFPIDRDNINKYVEIKALSDALALANLDDDEWIEDSQILYETLKKLIS